MGIKTPVKALISFCFFCAFLWVSLLLYREYFAVWMLILFLYPQVMGVPKDDGFWKVMIFINLYFSALTSMVLDYYM
ncbi:hypothetical protein GA0071314_0132 [Halomonas sp. HL-93]|nr:MAG: hypothetical protein HLUCCO06_17060 [Halomonas sp. HL-93]SBR45220.1 hypothetical protein GA0071314_0132 [Halomonas sp. HL-93]SNY97663.1 hypothetical protein SAMN04488142_2268 [Halomonas sp. hl-4]